MLCEEAPLAPLRALCAYAVFEVVAVARGRFCGPFVMDAKVWRFVDFLTAQRNCGAKAHSKFLRAGRRNKVSSVHGRRRAAPALWKRQSIQSTLRPRESLARQAHPAGQKQTRCVRLERALGMGSEAHRAAQCAFARLPRWGRHILEAQIRTGRCAAQGGEAVPVPAEEGQLQHPASDQRSVERCTAACPGARGEIRRKR